MARDARSKLVIRHSESKVLASKNSAVKYVRWIRLYQCLCGSEYSEGHHASEKRQTGWQNVHCPMYARIVSTNDETEANGAPNRYYLVYFD